MEVLNKFSKQGNHANKLEKQIISTEMYTIKKQKGMFSSRRPRSLGKPCILTRMCMANSMMKLRTQI